jgi:hypothetical protein
MALRHRLGWDARFCERSPWFWPLRRAAQRFSTFSDWPCLADLDALYAGATDGQQLRQLHFRDNVRKQDKRSGGRVVVSALYDARITLANEVPTRERDWHDLFNALCFATFPHSKLALHARQYRAMAERLGPDAERLPPTRTPEQDTLTLFDEGGIAVIAEPPLALQLEATCAEARASFCSELVSDRRARLVPFGHALFEHLVEGLRCPGGCTQVVATSELWGSSQAWFSAIDRGLAAAIEDSARFRSTRECSQIRFEALPL